jgi:hypothetical protein
MRSVPQKRQNAVAHELHARERRTALGRPELDAVGSGIPELDDPRRHLLVAVAAVLLAVLLRREDVVAVGEGAASPVAA